MSKQLLCDAAHMCASCLSNGLHITQEIAAAVGAANRGTTTEPHKSRRLSNHTQEHTHTHTHTVTVTVAAAAAVVVCSSSSSSSSRQ
jgi:hypothetical protein